MTSTFGQRLKAQRERQRIALADIAERTKIRVPLLEGLERDDFRHWPGGIFRRSYMRAYAHAIGMDPEAVVREFLELHPDPSDDLEPLGEVSPGRPPTRFRFLLGSALGSLPGRRPPQGAAAPALVAPPPVELEPHVSFVPAPDTADDAPAPAVAPPTTDLPLLADLCTRLATARNTRDLASILEDAAALLGAVGMIVWMWDPRAGVLRPVLSHGFDERMLAQLGGVSRDSDTPIAAAFRTAAARRVAGSVSQTGALVLPLLGPDGCPGVLALELRDGREAELEVGACATILAAQLSMLVGPQEVHAGNA